MLSVAAEKLQIDLHVHLSENLYSLQEDLHAKSRITKYICLFTCCFGMFSIKLQNSQMCSSCDQPNLNAESLNLFCRNLAILFLSFSTNYCKSKNTPCQ